MAITMAVVLQLSPLCVLKTKRATLLQGENGFTCRNMLKYSVMWCNEIIPAIANPNPVSSQPCLQFVYS